MGDDELEAILAALGNVMERYRAGEPARDEFEQELYDQFREIDGLIELVNDNFDFTVPDYVPDEWLNG